jgi:hypothetical protein
MSITIDDVTKAIMFDQYTDEQLNSVLEAVKYRRNRLIRENRRQLTVGARVKFVSRGRTVVGEVTKINPKYVHVREQANSFNGGLFPTNWKVPGNMLEVA